MKGSYTVEAALVFPLVLFSVLLVWFLGFYRHNQTACQAICREAVYVGLEARRCGRDAEAAMYKVLEEQTGHLPGVSETQIQVSVKDKELIANLEAAMHFPFRFLTGSSVPEVWVISGEASISSRHPAAVVRQIKRAEKLTDILSEE